MAWKLPTLAWQWFGDATYAGLLFALRMIAISLTGIIFSLISNHFSGQKIIFWAQTFQLILKIRCLEIKKMILDLKAFLHQAKMA